MAAKRVTVAQQKGGAGKTTLAVHLALTWAAGKAKVAMVDIDPQASLAGWFEARQASGADGLVPIDVVAISGWRLDGELKKLDRTHDIIVMDSPPHADSDAGRALRAADLAIIPVQPSPMDLWATRTTLDLAGKEKTAALLVLNRVPPRARLADTVSEEAGKLGAPLAKTRIGNRVALAAALMAGKGIAEFQPRGVAAAEIAALAKEVKRRL